MSTLTTINAGDSISSSRTVINSNLNLLNADKIETSSLDTDTTLAANSDSKIATQKAVKAYVDGVGTATATTIVKGIVEVATQAEVVAGTATGSTGASLVVTPSTLIGLSTPTVQTFTASGTWTKPSGLKYIIIEGVGAGATSSGTGSGGGGGYFRKLILVASLGATETVTIGTTGSPGGNTSFGAFCTGNGGTRPTGGTATGGDINIQGGNAQSSGSGGTGGNYGIGGSSQLGQGNTGAGGPTGYGAGAAGENGGSSFPNGTNGIVIVTEYYV